jgi:hypothetical protein
MYSICGSGCSGCCGCSGCDGGCDADIGEKLYIKHYEPLFVYINNIS